MEPNQPVSLNDAGRDVKSAKKLPASAHIMCGWPLFLVAIGGAIGGGLGGAAYGLNTVIYKSKLPLTAKVLLNLLTGGAAIAIWAIIALAIRSARK